MKLLLEVETLHDAYELYRAEIERIETENKAYALRAKLQTSLIRYTLPGWGFPLIQGEKMTAEEVAKGIQFMSEVSLREFTKALEVQEGIYTTLGSKVSGASRRTYRSALRQMLSWCEQQTWWKKIARSMSGEYAPPMRLSTKKCLPSIALKKHELPTNLRKQLHDLHDFYCLSME